MVIGSDGIVTDAALTFAGQNLAELMTDGAVTVDGQTIKVTGEIANIPNWEAFSDKVADRTGYYAPLILTGEKGNVIKMKTKGGENKALIFGQTNDTDTTMIVVWAVDAVSKKIQFTAYKNIVNSSKNENGTEYTIDFSGCNFVTASETE